MLTGLFLGFNILIVINISKRGDSVDNELRKLARMFKALGDENRLKILALVRESELNCACGEDGCDETRCMTQLVEMLGISQATVSHHVKELVDSGLLITRKKGRWVHCSTDKDGIARSAVFLSRLRGES